MKAVISHSKVFATSAALSFFFRDDFSGAPFEVSSGDINVNPALEPCVGCFRAEIETPIMPANPLPVNELFRPDAIFDKICTDQRLAAGCPGHTEVCRLPQDFGKFFLESDEFCV